MYFYLLVQVLEQHLNDGFKYAKMDEKVSSSSSWLSWYQVSTEVAQDNPLLYQNAESKIMP